MKEQTYQELLRLAREQTLLASCIELLGWDEETYLPRAGVAHRANQLALLSGLLHARATDPRVGELLAAVEGSAVLDEPRAQVNVREWGRVYDRLTRLPRALVEELSRVTSFAQKEWAEARRNAEFGRFRPWLEKVLNLK